MHRVGTMTDQGIGLSAYLSHVGKRANAPHYSIVIPEHKLPSGVAPYVADGGRFKPGPEDTWAANLAIRRQQL